MPVTSEDPWLAYGRTVVEIAMADGTTLRVRAAPEPDGVAAPGPWPWPDSRPVHVLTAWDPGAARPGPDVNRARQAALETDLLTLDLPLFAAAGLDPLTRRREEGVAVRGAAEAEVLALGARYGQDAVFAWTPDEWAVVACLGRRRLASGWALERFRFSQASDVPI